MKKPLSRAESIKACRDLWTFLAQNPSKPRFTYPPFLALITKGRAEELPLYSCYACEDAGRTTKDGKTETDCSKCFLLDLWRKGLTPLEVALVEELTGSHPCLAFKDSPYLRWKNAQDMKERTSHAWHIADFCNKLLGE